MAAATRDAFSQLPKDVQNALSANAGIVLKQFNPAEVGEDTAIQQNIMFATSGGVSTSCVFTYKDFGADIDNCPKNSKEMLQVESVECTMSGTAVTITSEAAVSLLGQADKQTSSSLDTVTPRMNIQDKDFQSLWYVCPYGTKNGFIAVELKNALSTGGLSIQSTDLEKGKFAFSYKGYTSLAKPKEVPFTFYVKADNALPSSLSLE